MMMKIKFLKSISHKLEKNRKMQVMKSYNLVNEIFQKFFFNFNWLE